MSKELTVAMDALCRFINKADAAFPAMPEVTVSFPTQRSLDRFRMQLMADTDAMTVQTWDRRLPPGIEAEINGIRIRLKVRT